MFSAASGGGRQFDQGRNWRMSFPVIAWPGFFGYTGIRLARQSRGKSFYLLWIPAYAGMTDKAGSCFIREVSKNKDL